jgi:hypothetical protein
MNFVQIRLFDLSSSLTELLLFQIMSKKIFCKFIDFSKHLSGRYTNKTKLQRKKIQMDSEMNRVRLN